MADAHVRAVMVMVTSIAEWRTLRMQLSAVQGLLPAYRSSIED